MCMSSVTVILVSLEIIEILLPIPYTSTFAMWNRFYPILSGPFSQFYFPKIKRKRCLLGEKTSLEQTGLRVIFQKFLGEFKIESPPDHLHTEEISLIKISTDCYDHSEKTEDKLIKTCH